MKDAPKYNVKAKSGTHVVNFDNYVKRMIDSKKMLYFHCKFVEIKAIRAYLLH